MQAIKDAMALHSSRECVVIPLALKLLLGGYLPFLPKACENQDTWLCYPCCGIGLPLSSASATISFLISLLQALCFQALN